MGTRASMQFPKTLLFVLFALVAVEAYPRVFLRRFSSGSGYTSGSTYTSGGGGGATTTAKKIVQTVKFTLASAAAYTGNVKTAYELGYGHRAWSHKYSRDSICHRLQC